MGNEFDQFADDYRTIHTNNVKGLSGVDSDYFSEYKIHEIREMLEGKRILDLGCGDGISSKYIREICHIKSYTGIDVSEKSIQVAKNRNYNDCDFMIYDGQHIPFTENSFDVVFIACVMHHIDVEQRVKILEECKRVLSNDGIIIIFEHNTRNPFTLKTVKDCPFDEGVILVKDRQLKRMLIEAGFGKEIRIQYTLFMPRKGIFLKMLSIEKHLKWCCFGAQYYCIAKK